jgi:ubiquitin carboxyl-terminal hydrolase 4/11/15
MSTVAAAASTPPPSSSRDALLAEENELEDASTLIKSQLELAFDFKTEGNAAYAHNQFKAALQAYQQGLDALKKESTLTATSESLGLRLDLLNNRAQVMLKLEDYAGAEEECSVVLDSLGIPLPKAFHRRARAREGLALQPLAPVTLAERRTLLEAAKKDLQAAIRVLDKAIDPSVTAAEAQRQKAAVAQSAVRLQQRLTQLEKVAAGKHKLADSPKAVVPAKPATNKSKKQTVDASTARTRRSRRPPTVVTEGSPTAALRGRGQQRQDVLRLLLSRQTQVQLAVALPGEAFFVMDWLWWSDFCHHVDLFYQKEKGAQGGMVLRALPLGTIIPGSEQDDEEDDYDGPPGPIDNSDLFLVSPTATEETSQQAFFRQWYRASTEQPIQLKPNLVRGYHYEILPREVYHALREWYGEVTPAICRNATVEEGKAPSLVLYSHLHEAVPPLLPWNTNVYERCGACRRPGIRLRCRRCMGVYYCNRGCQQGHWPLHKSFCKPVDPEDTPNFVAQSDGRVGLINLGNTCFMNSALQCLSHTAPLTRHFLSGNFVADVSRTNPLGTGGKLADAYAAVMKELWMRPGARQAKPHALKRAIALFAPRFAGTLQHDAQEFLAYLLDGLHEDLNRIQQAPYVEMPDFRDGQNMGVAGSRAWEAHLRRNDSLVLDTFYGQFKSTCVCPRCKRVSVSFDAFNHVSLEIPQNNAIVPITVLIVGAAKADESGESDRVVPLRCSVSFRKANPLSELMKELSKISGIPFQRLHLCEVQNQNIVTVFRDNETAMGIKPSDLLVAYEADPFASPCFHVLTRHKAVRSSDETTKEDYFGLPLLTSFPTTYTCEQVWQHFANLSKDKVKDPEDIADVLHLRLHDGKGNPMEVFPLEPEIGEDQSDEIPKTSAVPKDLEVPLASFLGPRAHESFLCIWMEWRDISSPEMYSQDGDEKESTRRVDEDRFFRVDDHPSYVEAMQQRKATANKKTGVTLDECFQTFIKPERLDEKNTWYCSRCKDHVRAMKTMELWRLPNVLVVHLKRFEFRNVLRRDKLETSVQFPIDGLDMSEHCASDGTVFVDERAPAVYDLYGVVNHFGRLGFGHYTAFAREWNELGEMGDWTLFDDSSTSRVDGNSVVTPSAYVLFYRRRTWT